MKDLSIFSKPAASFAEVFSPRLDQIISAGEATAALTAINKIGDGYHSSLKRLDQLKEPAVVASFLTRYEAFEEVRRVLGLSVPFLDPIHRFIREKGELEKLTTHELIFLLGMLGNLEIPAEQIAPYDCTPAAGMLYGKVWLYFRDGDGEVNQIGLPPGGATTIHDHAGRASLERGNNGGFFEQTFEKDFSSDRVKRRAIRPGAEGSASFETGSMIHRVVNASDKDVAVTMPFFRPNMVDAMTIYKE